MGVRDCGKMNDGMAVLEPLDKTCGRIKNIIGSRADNTGVNQETFRPGERMPDLRGKGPGQE